MTEWTSEFKRQETWIFNTHYVLFGPNGPKAHEEYSWVSRIDELAKCIGASTGQDMRLIFADCVINIEGHDMWHWMRHVGQTAPSEQQMVKMLLPNMHAAFRGDRRVWSLKEAQDAYNKSGFGPGSSWEAQPHAGQPTPGVLVWRNSWGDSPRDAEKPSAEQLAGDSVSAKLADDHDAAVSKETETPAVSKETETPAVGDALSEKTESAAKADGGETKKDWTAWEAEREADLHKGVRANVDHILGRIDTLTNGVEKPATPIAFGVLLEYAGANLRFLAKRPLADASMASDGIGNLPACCITILGGPKGMTSGVIEAVRETFKARGVMMLTVALGEQQQMAHVCMGYLRVEDQSGRYKAALTDLLRLGQPGYADFMAAVDAALPALCASAVGGKKRKLEE